MGVNANMLKDAGNFILHGGAIHLTENPLTAYEVVSGQVLVYVMPIINDKPGRRYLLYKASPGEILPSFAIDKRFNAELGEVWDWRFGLVALDTAEIKALPCACDEDLCREFVRRAKMLSGEFLSFEECVTEQYRLNEVTELRNLYVTEQEQAAAYQGGLQMIANFFKKAARKPLPHPTGHRLYDALAYLCAVRGMAIATLEDIQSSAGPDFTIEDVARVSRFPVREIILTGPWYKQDTGSLIAFTQEGKKAVTCWPVSPSKYKIWDPETGVTRILDAGYARTLAPQAYMIYRPLPARSVGLRDLIRFIFKDIYTGDVVRLIALSLVSILVALLIPWMSSRLYDTFIPLGNTATLLQVSWVLISAMIGSIGFHVVKNLAAQRTLSTAKYALFHAVIDRIFNLPESFFRKYDCADLAQRAIDINALFRLFTAAVITGWLSALCGLVYLLGMFSYSAALTWLALALLALTVGAVLILARKQIQCQAQLLESDARANSFMYQILNGIAKIRIAGIENRAIHEYLKPYIQSRRMDQASQKLTLASTTLITAMTAVFSLAFYAWTIISGMRLSLGAFSAFTAAFSAFSAAVLTVAQNLTAMGSAGPLYERLRPLLETLPETTEDTELPGRINGEIEVLNVTFSYNQAIGNVLQDISLHIQPGEYIGIVGASGCGKSTLLKLLLGFEKPQTGKIYYDGRDIDSLDKRELRKKFGVVLQDGKLIAGTIYDNITITAPQVNRAQVEAVIAEVGLGPDIARMPMGLSTMLAENAGTISGGQLQRILIARAIVNRPRILFFDEATSALDNTTQALVTEALAKLHSTRVVIAHRLSTIIGCDRIIVMEAGRIIEQGSYQELMAQNGRFYELASRQLA